ncbi:MAG: EAL domain-containing protein [Comamonadaceae bacterium]|nr:MAG: EAL domain-containing protein [Comamonadaceae bacterium]
MVSLLGGGLQGLYGLEPFLDLVVVLIGLLAVAVSLHMLDDSVQERANILVLGLATAAVCNFLHTLLQHRVETASVGVRLDVSLYFGVLARVVEALTLLAFALRITAPGPSRAWAAGAAVMSLALLWSGAGRLPGLLSLSSQSLNNVAFSLGCATAFALAAVLLFYVRDGQRTGREQLMAWAAGVLALAEGASLGRIEFTLVADTTVHALRVLGYALLFQAVFVAGIRTPYARAREAEARLRESETRLQLLGRNLPGSVLYQMVRERDGRRHFVHMGDAIARLNGVAAPDVMRDASVLYEQILPEDRALNALAEEQSYRSMGVSECVVRMRRPDGQVRWMRLSSSPRGLDKGRVIWDGVLTDVTEQREAERVSRARDLQLAGLLKHLPGGVTRVGRDLRILYVNPLQAEWLHCTVSALDGQLLHDVLPLARMARLRPHLDQALAGTTVAFENRIDYDDGPHFRHTTLVPELEHDGSVGAVVIFAYDLTDQKRMEQELNQQRTQLASLVSAIPDMVFLKDARGRYLSCNPVFERYMGRREAAIVGLADDVLLAHGEAERVREFDQRAMEAWQPLVYEETLTFAEDGYVGRFETIKTPIRDPQGRVVGVLGVCRDITDRKKAEQEIERLAFYDALTGLPNRRLLLDRLQRAATACQRSQQLGALLFIDLDNFKDLNDTLGHDMGDQLLAQVAGRLVDCVRETDTVARFGGDEFVVMLENLNGAIEQAATQAEHIAEKLLAQLNQPFKLGGAAQHYSTPSIGITLFGDQRCSVDELLKRADLAMYQAKAAGRNTQRFFDPGMQAQVNARSQLEADLRQGLARSEFSVHYQPVVDERTRLCGAEALVRWMHPKRGMVSPGEFIALAEQTALILPLGRFVLQQACEQLVRWSRYDDTRHLSISVNVSARQFRQPAFATEVLDILAQTGARPDLLKLELTESLLLGDIEDTVARMAQLKKEGVGFALDDFGTGYSSLSYLKRLPLDQVKIDQSFVRDVLTDPNDAAIVRTILALAKSLDLQVVAEGVETTGQLSFLKLHGCDGFQGYLFGRPCPVGQFEREQQLAVASTGAAATVAA